MNLSEKFEKKVATNIRRLGSDAALPLESLSWMLRAAMVGNYTYNFKWLGRPIIQFPQDTVALQELIWKIKPDLIIETGIAHGGSLIFSSSMIALLDICDAIQNGITFDPKNSKRKVLGIDIKIRQQARAAIEAHPMGSRIAMIQGSSVAPEVISQVHKFSKKYKRILVCLDSNHTHEHVLGELEAYAPLVSVGSYCVVMDTLIDVVPKSFYVNRPWGPGNNPKTAVWDYLKTHPEFKIDKSIQDKLLITVAPDGFLKRVS